MSIVDHSRLVNLIDQIKQYYYNMFLYVDIVQVHACDAWLYHTGVHV